MTTIPTDPHVASLASELRLAVWQVGATASLLDGGATVPFLARYRKEATGSMDEVAIAAVRDGLERLRDLAKRRAAILESLQERGLLTSELQANILAAASSTHLEDVYLPYRPKRRTRAMIATERGLGPLAIELWRQDGRTTPMRVAESFVNSEAGIDTAEDALAGARDIMAEWVSEDGTARRSTRDLFAARGMLRSKLARGKEVAGAKFRDYFDWAEPVARAPSHRILAVFRGETEGFLSVKIDVPDDLAHDALQRLFVRSRDGAGEQVRLAVEDGFKRLLGPSIETETRAWLKERADETAIGVFADNLRNLLMAAPLGERAVLAIDPGFRTGCKVVCLDRQGKLLDTETVYLHLGEERTRSEAAKIKALADRYQVEAIAIGNGTAGRETETVVRALGLSSDLPIVMVNESGASVYSASVVARAEFPDQDVTVRGAVSIGRRLMDPLAELVKIDPKAIGVGQYQHDVDQAALAARLRDVVESCVNAVGVNVNTASRELMTHVSGLGPKLSEAIVTYRDANGPFRSRSQLLRVPRLGPKAYEQAAGFLRIQGGSNPLDASGVHPESYGVVESMARSLGRPVSSLVGSPEITAQQADITQWATEKIGLATLRDIVSELARPGRDPRHAFEVFSFEKGIEKITDLSEGLRLPGVVTNVAAFGAFVDIGVHQDGLVHISQLADRFVSDPREVVQVGQRVVVSVLSVDLERGRIALSMKN